MQKRTFSISHIVLENLYNVSEGFHINKATIARIAVCHGIERVKNGYLPLRNHKKKRKEKFELSLPEETWIEFGTIMECIEYKLEEHIPDGEMIEIFLEIELRKFINMMDEYENELDSNNLYSFSDCKIISINAELPIMLYNRLQDKKEKIGVKHTQMEKYIIACGAIQEYVQGGFDTLDTDADLLKEIEILGLDKLKAMTLIKYLIASERIIWKKRD